MLALAAALAGELGWPQATPLAWTGVAYQCVVVCFASYLTWFWLVARYPAGRLSAFTFLTPLLGVLALARPHRREAQILLLRRQPLTQCNLALPFAFALSLALAQELAGDLGVALLLAVQVHARAHALVVVYAALRGRRHRLGQRRRGRRGSGRRRGHRHRSWA